MYHDPDFGMLPYLLPAQPVCIDVGANAGQSVHSIKRARPEAIIHSFEPNPEFSEKLQALRQQYQNVNVYSVGLGARDAKITFHVPVINGIRYLEETTMRLESLQEPWILDRFKQRGGEVRFESFDQNIVTGDSFGFKPDLIKIDVEGVESEVVQGFASTIRQHAPILLIENGDWHRLAPIIAGLGYVPMMPDENATKLIPFSGQRTNTFYIKA